MRLTFYAVNPWLLHMKWNVRLAIS